MPTAGDVLVETLIDWGVNTIFGLPGDGINGIIESLRQRKDKIRFIQVRHEEAAAFMACAYAKVTGRLGVCLATSGPGGIHLLNGLYDAKLDGAPVLAITGMQFHDLLHTHTQQDVELDKLFEDVCVYNCRIMGPAHTENVVSLACREAMVRRGVAHVTMPVDMQSEPISEDVRSPRNVAHHVSSVQAYRAGLPTAEDLELAAQVLNEGEKIAILAGRGAIGAGPLLEQIAETLGAVIIKPLLGKASVPDESPYCLGGTGLLGTRPSQEAIEDCDTLLIAGSSFPYIEFYPKPGKARCVQIDIDGTRIGLRYPVEIGLVGDSAKTLELLLPLLKRKESRRFLERAQKNKKEWDEMMAKQAGRDTMPMKPQVVAHAIGQRLAGNAVYVSDSGTIASWFARFLPFRYGQMCTLSGNLATMACGLPYAIAAQIAYPDRQVVALVGDGGFSMLMAEFVTAVKYQLPVKIVIFKNNSLGQIKWEQMVFLGNPEYACELQPIDFARFAEACGGYGITITDPRECAAQIEEAFAHPGPVIVEAVVDPNEPPYPPKATLKDMKNLAEALARGTPHGGEIIRNIIGDKVRELV
ncbi:MAG: pyruvate oxidase [Pseudomonadota bacterium]|nr:pyruvate oxidase [Pseudomonadota bacterium]